MTIQFGTPVDTMGPYYAEVDLNDTPVSLHDKQELERLIEEAGGKLAVEVKEDGFRCQAHVNDTDIHLFTRGMGTFETRCLPDIITALQSLNLRKTIVDAELIGAGGGYSGFKAVQSRA